MGNDQRRTTLVRHLSTLWRTTVAILRDYVVGVRWKGEADGFRALRGLIRRGPLYWPGLVMLVCAVIAAPYLSRQAGRFATASTSFVEETVQTPLPALYLSLLVIALGWAYLLLGAHATGLATYFVASAYVTYYGLSLGSGLTSPFWFVLVPVWLLAVGAWGAAIHGTRWRGLWIVGLSLLAALHTYIGLGLHRLLSLPWGLLLPAAAYFGLLGNRWVAGRRPIRPSLVFIVTLALFLSLYSATLHSAPAGQFSPYVVFVFRYVLPFLEIFWFWMGAQLIETARTLAGWTLARLEALMPRTALSRTVAVLWLGWTIALAVLTYAYRVEGTAATARDGWQGAVLSIYLSLKPSLALVEASWYHVLVNLALAIYMFVLQTKKRLSTEKLLQVVGVSLLAFFIAYGYFSAFYSLHGATDVLSGPQPLLIFVALMLWETTKASSDLAAGSGHRAGLLLGCLLIVASISLFELTTDAEYFAMLLAVTPFVGAVCLGLPYLLYTVLYEQRRFTPVPAEQLRLVFLLGMASAIPCLWSGRLFFAPALWLVIVLGTVWRRGRWESALDGLTYLLAIGLGFSVYYVYPLAVPIPPFTRFLSQLAQAQLVYTIHKTLPWDPQWWSAMAGPLVAAALLGYVLWRARPASTRKQAGLLIGAALLSCLFLAGWQSAFFSVLTAR